MPAVYYFSRIVSLLMSVPDSWVRYACNLGKVHESDFLSHVFDINRSPSVSGLGFCCGPTAVIGGVRSVVVDAVNGHAFRPLTHVLLEVLKLLPARIYGYAYSSVVMVVAVVRVIASRPHLQPVLVIPSACHSMSDTRNAVFAKTAAGLGVTASNSGETDDLCVSAITDKPPMGVFLLFVRKGDSRINGRHVTHPHGSRSGYLVLLCVRRDEE